VRCTGLPAGDGNCDGQRPLHNVAGQQGRAADCGQAEGASSRQRAGSLASGFLTSSDDVEGWLVLLRKAPRGGQRTREGARGRQRALEDAMRRRPTFIASMCMRKGMRPATRPLCRARAGMRESRRRLRRDCSCYCSAARPCWPLPSSSPGSLAAQPSLQPSHPIPAPSQLHPSSASLQRPDSLRRASAAACCIRSFSPFPQGPRR
jgi:hypothetical protein